MRYQLCACHEEPHYHQYRQNLQSKAPGRAPGFVHIGKSGHCQDYIQQQCEPEENQGAEGKQWFHYWFPPSSIVTTKAITIENRKPEMARMRANRRPSSAASAGIWTTPTITQAARKAVTAVRGTPSCNSCSP